MVVVLLGAAAFGAWRGYQSFMNGLVAERCYVTLDEGRSALTEEQAGNAAIIVAASFKAGLPERAAVVALATAWQESGLRNLDYGDRDSLGLFQQRPSYGWGTEAEIMDPWYSSARFYEELVKFDGWESVDVNDMAQKVQRSGFPEAYRKHEANAVALAGSLRGSRPGSLACVDRSEEAGNVDAFDSVMRAVPGVEITTEGNIVTITADDGTALWAATQLALTHTNGGGIQSAIVEDQAWEQGPKGAWHTARAPLPSGTAQLTLRVVG
ncbi:hypothetical protein EAX62_14600 [Tessaracoccus antarcticus]|uniref:Heavy metal transporter n=1 Tax=Tessaracoccus antarcticus TaxID=2479848 RepID=A0A3M0GM86_9ACTN|nr:hypothetical protein EAX62_14600 [Tessaracoccus antarcticus]